MHHQSSLLLQGMFELWGEGNDWPELLASIERYPMEKKLPYLAEDQSLKMVIDGFGCKFNPEQQLELIERFACMEFKVIRQPSQCCCST